MGAEKPESTSILTLDKKEEDRKSAKVEESVSLEELNRRNRQMQTKEQTDLGKELNCIFKTSHRCKMNV